MILKLFFQRKKHSNLFKGKNHHEKYTYEKLFGKEKTEFQKNQGCGYGHKSNCKCIICKKIKQHNTNSLFKDKNWLLEQYYGNDLTLEEMAKLTKTTKSTIIWWMRKYGYEVQRFQPLTARSWPNFSRSWSFENFSSGFRFKEDSVKRTIGLL